MRKLTIILLIIAFNHVFADLPIIQTRFRKAPVEQVQQAARQDNAEAQLELAQRYYAGHQVPHNAQEAFNWMTRSAGLANPDAQFLLSRMYAEGVGTAPDADKEEHYFALSLAAQPDSQQMQTWYDTYLEQKKGSPDDQRKFISRCAEAGYTPAYAAVQYPAATNFFAKGQYTNALPIFIKLAEQGDPASSGYLAKMYSKGLGGLPQDNIEAFGLYERAASNNYAEAQYQLAVMYEEGRGILEDEDKAVFWYEKAARNGHADAQYRFAESEFRKAESAEQQIGEEYAEESQRDAVKARFQTLLAGAAGWYQKAAEQGHTNAQYMAGRCYASGEGVGRDFEKAVRYYEKASAAGHAEAQFHLGLMYHAGLGVQPDISKAIQLYTKAADKGEQGAMFYLGNCYCFGVGVPKDIKKGEQWYDKATKAINRKALGTQKVSQGVVDAARELGIILWTKGNSDAEFKKAKDWLGLAAQNGDQFSQDILLKVNIRDRRSYKRGVTDEFRPVIPMNCADARLAAQGAMRETTIIPYYLQTEAKTLFPKSEAQRDLQYVTIDWGVAQSVAGDDLWRIHVKFSRPRQQAGADFKGKMLIAVEFTDTETSKRYVALGQYETSNIDSIDNTDKELWGFVNLSKYPKAKLTGYSVVYGHQVQDDIVLAVFDEETNSRRVKTFSELFLRNRKSTQMKIVGVRELI